MMRRERLGKHQNSPGIVVIRKYPNRRLYDPSVSQYIKYRDVIKYILSGDTVEVIDRETGVDITRVLLTTILAEMQQTSEIFSASELHEIIRSNAAGRQAAA